MAPTPTGDGYWLVASDGGIFAFGDAQFHGSTAGDGVAALGIIPTATGEGYWIAGADGIAGPFGDAAPLDGARPPGTPAGLAARPQGDGYWVVDTDGRVATSGAAADLGDLAALALNEPIVGVTSTPSGDGYWLVASDGGIFAFGDAQFHGSTGSITLNQPIVGMAPTPTGDGYWLVASDGGIFAFPTTEPDPAPGSSPQLAGCDVLPADNAWNQPIDDLPVHTDSDAWISRAGADRNAHPDFGANWNGGPFGIPFVVVDDTQPDVPITFTAYGSESDPGPYPVPLDAPVEGGSDRHVIVLDSSTCTLYELFAAEQVGAGWEARSGAVFDIGTNELRPLGWTSADAAGLPILPGLVRYDEVAAGSIDHALRVTFACTQRGYILPATHQAGVDDASCPPMGARLRLRADVDLSGYSGQSLVLMEALQTYGAFVADNGSSFYFSGAPDARWSDQDLNQIKTLVGSDFEFVETGPIRR